MYGIWLSLAWKEWHEHKWKLAALVTIVLGVCTVPLYWNDSATLPSSMGIAMLCIAPLALFMGASEATSERARGTMSFTRALPAPSWQVACVKLVFGWLTCLTPVLLNLVFCCGVYVLIHYFQGTSLPRLTNPFTRSTGNSGLSAWLAFGAMSGTAMATSMFLWSAAIGVRLKDEISAAAWSLLTIVVWWMGLVLIAKWFVARIPQDEWLVPALFASSPGGMATFLFDGRVDPNPGLTLCVALCVHLALAASFVWRYGGSFARDLASPQLALIEKNQQEWLAPPRTSQYSALAWKQCRESAPIVIAGLAGTLIFAATLYAADPKLFDAKLAGKMIAGVAAYVGAVATLVVGIGVFLSDLSPNLNTFWRSRPINPNGWFWTKFLTGFTVLALAFSIPFAVAAALDTAHLERGFFDMAHWIILAPLWIYSAAILMTCLVRHAVYAGILSTSIMVLATVLVIGVIRFAKMGLGQIAWADLRDPTAGELTTAMVVSTIAFTVLAWLAVRNDWGRQSRY